MFLDVLILLGEWDQFVMTIVGYQLLNFNSSILFHKIYIAVVTLSEDLHLLGCSAVLRVNSTPASEDYSTFIFRVKHFRKSLLFLDCLTLKMEFLCHFRASGDI